MSQILQDYEAKINQVKNNFVQSWVKWRRKGKVKVEHWVNTSTLSRAKKRFERCSTKVKGEKEKQTLKQSQKRKSKTKEEEDPVKILQNVQSPKWKIQKHEVENTLKREIRKGKVRVGRKVDSLNKHPSCPFNGSSCAQECVQILLARISRPSGDLFNFHNYLKHPPCPQICKSQTENFCRIYFVMVFVFASSGNKSLLATVSMLVVLYSEEGSFRPGKTQNYNCVNFSRLR